MSGAVALHGGGEFLPGDEPFLAALLDVATSRIGDGRPIRIAVVPTAAARGRPESAAMHGVAAFERVAASSGREILAEAVAVVDAASAADAGLSDRLAHADVIHLPGGDPDLVATVLAGSAAWTAIERARAAGAILAGASAGAMALATWTWTPTGGMPGLGVVPGLLVVPHADPDRWADVLERFGAAVPGGLGAMGLAEQTGVLAEEVSDGGGPIRWRVVGPGEVRWLPRRDGPTLVARSGDTFETGLPPAYGSSAPG
jgi:cyanophycinase-like exopeptidase